MKIMHSKIMDLSQNYVNPFSVGHNSSRWHFYIFLKKKKQKKKKKKKKKKSKKKNKKTVRPDILCELSTRQMLYIKCEILFSLKNISRIFQKLVF